MSYGIGKEMIIDFIFNPEQFTSHVNIFFETKR
jgi:hypothetical protein